MNSTTASHPHHLGDLDGHLGRLAVRAPRRLGAQLSAGWVRTEGPVGDLYVAFTERGTCAADFVARVGDDPEPFEESVRDLVGLPVHEARRAPSGLRRALDTGDARHLALDLRTLTDFEQAVLHKTVEIPNGEIRPYGWVAGEIGRPRAVRATGTALAHNPIPVVVPCHRVVRGDGILGNYSGGGPAVKRAILESEGLDLHDVLGLAEQGFRLVGSDTTRIVCYPSCRDARRITARHRVSFRSLDEAAAAGYRPCLQCRPAPAPAAAPAPAPGTASGPAPGVTPPTA